MKKNIFSIVNLLGVLIVMLVFSGCVTNKNLSTEKTKILHKNLKDLNVTIINKKKENTKLVLLDLDKSLTPKDVLWCKLESQRFFVEMMQAGSNLTDYRNILNYYNSIPEEEAAYFAYNLTSHLLRMGCVKDKPNKDIVLTHSVVGINKNLKKLDALLCKASEQIFFANQVSIREKENLDYKQSKTAFSSFDSYEKNQIISVLTNNMEERKCAK